MTENLAEKFIEALKNLESNNDIDGIVALFADDCEIGNVALSENLKGADGAREFWTSYRKTFKDVSSNFKNKIIADGAVALEWTTVGTSVENHQINYEGVSIFEMSADKIIRFQAYFNPAKLGSQITE